MGNRTKTVKTLGVMKGGSQANILHLIADSVKNSQHNHHRNQSLLPYYSYSNYQLKRHTVNAKLILYTFKSRAINEQQFPKALQSLVKTRS